MKKVVITLAVALLGSAYVGDAFAQQQFFTLSGGTRGDTANAKQESQISELGSRMDRVNACVAQGLLYTEGHPAADSNGCVSSVKIEDDGNVSVSTKLTVAGNVQVGDDLLRKHALKDTPICKEDQKLTWSGNDWICQDEKDPTIASTVTNKWCISRNGKIYCDQEAPSSDTDVSAQVSQFVSEKVRDFARTDGSMPFCSGGEVLVADGSTLKCVSLDAMAQGTLTLDDLSDASISLPQNEDILHFNGTQWVANALVQPFTKLPVKDLVNERCAVGDVLTFDGVQFSCVPDIGGAGDAINLIDLGDVEGTDLAALNNILMFDGTSWKPTIEQDTTVEAWAKTAIGNLVADKCDAGDVLSYDGTELACVPDAGGVGSELTLDNLTDVDVTTVSPVSDNILKFNGTQWVPSASAGEVDPTVQSFAKNANPLPTCGAGQLLSADGTALTCADDAGGSADSLEISDLSDVTVTTPSTHDALVFKAGQFVNVAQAICGAGEVLKYDGTDYKCVSVTDLGLWADNTTYISRGSAHVINNGEALPAALAGAGTRTVWYPQKGAFRAGTANATSWNDANVGTNSTAFGLNTVALGANAFASGDTSNASGIGSVAMGMSGANGDYGTAMGHLTYAHGDSSVALGDTATATGNHSVAIGLDTTAFDVTDTNTMAIMGGKVGIGTVSPNSALEVVGTVIIGDGSEACDAPREGALKYATADNSVYICNGTAWNKVATSGGSGTLALNDLADSATNATSVFVGTGSGDAIVSGTNNTATGVNVLTELTTGSYNTGFGESSLAALIASDSNSAFGQNALRYLESGASNVAIGTNALAGNVAGVTGADNNVAIGKDAGLVIDDDMDDNTFIGHSAGADQTAGSSNIAIGSGVSLSNLTGDDQLNIGNTIYGDLATDYIGIGVAAPATKLDVSGSIRIADGGEACAAPVAGAIRYTGGNVEFCNGTAWGILTSAASAVGALNDLSDGKTSATSVLLGSGAGTAVTGVNNTALGIDALTANTAGTNNVAIGKGAAATQTAGNNNIAIGSGAVLPSTTASNQLNIGDTVYGDLANDKIAIGGAVTAAHATVDVQGTIKVAGTNSEVCDGANVGSIRFNSGTGRMQICRP